MEDFAQSIQHDQEAGKFIYEQDGKRSYLTYTIDGDAMDFQHTYVPPALRGQSIASKIVRYGLEYAQKHGYKVNPSCPFVASYMNQHSEFDGIRV